MRLATVLSFVPRLSYTVIEFIAIETRVFPLKAASRISTCQSLAYLLP